MYLVMTLTHKVCWSKTCNEMFTITVLHGMDCFCEPMVKFESIAITQNKVKFVDYEIQ
jgi:hypothetical protein